MNITDMDEATKDQLVALAKDLERRSDVEGSAAAYEAHGYIVHLERKLGVSRDVSGMLYRQSKYNKNVTMFITAVLGISWTAFFIYIAETVVFK